MTIKDLSAQTGYSLGTISRVLNGHPNVSEKARQTILAAVRESGFQLNANAKRLKQQHATSILAVVKGTSNELFGALIEHIQRLVDNTKYPLIVDYLDEDDNEVRRVLQLSREKKPVGILFLGGNSVNFLRDFDKIDVPCVLLTRDASDLKFPNLSSVTSDDREAAAAAIDCLVALGHRRIGVIGGDRVISDTSRLRYEGCREAFSRHGIDFDEDLDYQGVRYSYSDGYRAAQSLLARGRRFTAIFAMADVMAIGAIRALRDTGLRVPEDVSVMGFDGLPIGEYFVPKLATVTQGVESMARRSVEILRNQIEKNGPCRHETVPVTVERKESAHALGAMRSETMRASGILMHVTSLPGPNGVGAMGETAYAFVDFLERAGQKYWQILPMCPTGYGDSPYQAFSTFAGNHYLIDLETLVKQGLLTREEVDSVTWSKREDRVDYGALYESRTKVLYQAYKRFQPGEDFHQFCLDNQDWLADYSLFMAVKESHDGDWLSWPEGLRLRDAAALEEARQIYKDRIEFHGFLQYTFFTQWEKLRAYAKGKGISIIGDVPIYVPLDSADVWANYELFQLDENRRPKLVAGVPPDGFTADGQLWGNPLYDWAKMKETGYAWWLHRLGAAAKMYDVVRLDHFRGFESYWAVPAEDINARGGKWLPGPGWDFISVIREKMPDLRFIAEDLGYLTPKVRKLQKDSGYPGMKVLEFAFDAREPSDYLPHRYTKNSVCYTGTHDNMTMRQWLDQASEADAAYAKAYMGLNQEEGYVWGMIRGGMSSVSDLFVAQMQDYLGLGGEARMNFPGTLSEGNWTWRALPGSYTDDLADRIREMTKLYGRV